MNIYKYMNKLIRLISFMNKYNFETSLEFSKS